MAITFISSVSVLAIKYSVLKPRPFFAGNVDSPFSFPSGHTVLSAAVYSFLVMSLSSSKSSKKVYYKQLTLFLLLISYSRIYTYAHWTTDVMFGLILGLIIALISSFFYYGANTRIKTKHFITAFIIPIFIGVIIYAKFNLSSDVAAYKAPSYPSINMTKTEWLQDNNLKYKYISL